jgi:rhamnose transport system permease protein
MFARYFREWSVAGALGLLLLLLAVQAPAFFKPAQVLSKLVETAPTLLVACGAAMIIICRQIDISVGSQFAWCGYLAGLAAAKEWGLVASAAVAIGVGAMLGAVNGLLVAGLGLPSIVVTLATMITLRDSLKMWSDGEYVSGLPNTFQYFGLNQDHGQYAIILLAAALFLILVVALKHLAAGRLVYAVGSDAEAARLAGVRPARVTFTVFVLMGALTGLAALLAIVRFPDVDPNMGQGLEMQAIAASVVGGIAISGGRGTLWGVLVGVLLLACISPALIFLKTIEPQWEKAIQGGIILLAVAADGYRLSRVKGGAG